MNDFTIKTASDIQLHNMVRRLRLEREAQRLILSIRRATKGDSEFDYLDSGVSTEEKISNLYDSGMIDPSDEFLEHFGVKGMKWGVRKDRSGGSNGGKQTRKEKKAEKKAKKEGGSSDGSKSGNSSSSTTKSPQDAKATTEAGKAWDKKANNELGDDLFEDVFLDDSILTRASNAGDKAGGSDTVFLSTMANISNKKLYSDPKYKSPDGRVMQMVVVKDEKGRAAGLESSIVKDTGKPYSFKTSDFSPEDELKHFGVLGMKWGVRKDKDRVGKSGAKKDGAIKRHLKKKYALNSDSKKELKEVEGKPKKTLDDKAMDHLKKKRAERVKNKNKISKMSDTELRQKINRLQMEKQYKQLTTKDKSQGVKIASSVLSKIGNKVVDRVIDRTIVDPIDDFIKGKR